MNAGVVRKKDQKTEKFPVLYGKYCEVRRVVATYLDYFQDLTETGRPVDFVVYWERIVSRAGGQC